MATGLNFFLSLCLMRRNFQTLLRLSWDIALTLALALALALTLTLALPIAILPRSFDSLAYISHLLANFLTQLSSDLK